MRKTLNRKIDLAAALAAVDDRPAQPLTLAELVAAWSSATLDGSDTRLRKWVDAFGSLCAWDIQSETLEKAASVMLENGYKPASINRDLSSLGSMYRWAKARRLSPRGFRSPTLDIRRFEEPIRRVELAPDMADAIRARARGFRDRRFAVFVELLFDTGARKSELLARRWSEVSLERGEILCPTTKTGVPRVLHFRPETAQLMRRVFPKRKDESLIFEGKVPGQPIGYRTSWQMLLKDVGLEDFHLHDIRHTVAASLLRSGTTLPVAAQVMGHSSQVLARRYGHLETATLRQAQERAWGGSSS